MKIMQFLSVFVILLAASFVLAGSQPNVVLIYGDDVGYGDVGIYGSKLIPTPNIDRLAREGLRFTDGHCSAATCTPSRFSLLSGEYGFRKGVNVLPPNAPLTIETEVMTLPRVFKKAGYVTGVIGKWHIGLGTKGVSTDWNGEVKPGPLELGFDFSYLLPSTNDRVPCVYLEGHKVVNLDPGDPLFVGRSKANVDKPGSTEYPDGKKNPEAMTYYKSTQGHNGSVINGIGRIGYMAGGKSALWNDETMADVFVEQAKNYIESNKEKPFFLYFASQDIHVPRAPNKRFKGKSELTYRGDAMVQLDWATGEIMKSLEENGLTENTIVIFSSDNGPVYDDGYEDGTTVFTSSKEVDRGHDASGIYRGGKYQIYEGGTRVPFIVRWPNHVKPGVSTALVNQTDFIASFASFLNVKLNDEDAPDSRDTMDAFLGIDSAGLPYMVEEAFRRIAIRVGEWKYVGPSNLLSKNANKSGNNAELYNLSEDPSEKNNIIEKHPDKAKELDKLLKKVISSNRMR